MLPKKNRITRKEFPAFQKGQGIRIFSGFFTGTAYHQQVSEIKVSVVVSKKVSKLATKRNSIRRSFYNAMRPILPMFSNGFLIVLVPKKEAFGVSCTLLTEELEKSFKAAKLID